jgi:hypothetical protein
MGLGNVRFIYPARCPCFFSPGDTPVAPSTRTRCVQVSARWRPAHLTKTSIDAVTSGFGIDRLARLARSVCLDSVIALRYSSASPLIRLLLALKTRDFARVRF